MSYQLKTRLGRDPAMSKYKQSNRRDAPKGCFRAIPTTSDMPRIRLYPSWHSRIRILRKGGAVREDSGHVFREIQVIPKNIWSWNIALSMMCPREW
jgi:hypothetical protein